MNILEDIKSLSNEIERVVVEANELDTKINYLELECLRAVIKTCKGSFRFSKILETEINWCKE